MTKGLSARAPLAMTVWYVPSLPPVFPAQRKSEFLKKQAGATGGFANGSSAHGAGASGNLQMATLTFSQVFGVCVL
jgi:hypothetical protein